MLILQSRIIKGFMFLVIPLQRTQFVLQERKSVCSVAEHSQRSKKTELYEEFTC